MIKVGENSRTKYCLDGKPYTAPALIRHLDRQRQAEVQQETALLYIVADVTFADTKVRLYFVRRSKRGAWNGLMTTDIRLSSLKRTGFMPKVVFGSRVQGSEGAVGAGQMPGRQLRLANRGDIPDGFAIQHPFLSEEVCSLRHHGKAL